MNYLFNERRRSATQFRVKCGSLCNLQGTTLTHHTARVVVPANFKGGKFKKPQH